MSTTTIPYRDRIISSLRKERYCQVGGTWGSSYLYILSQIYPAVKPGVTLIVTSGVAEAESALEDCPTFLSEAGAGLSRPYLFPAEQNPTGLQMQLHTIIALQEKRSPLLIIAPVQSLDPDGHRGGVSEHNLPPPEILSSNLMTFRTRSVLKMSSFARKLIDTGFERVDQVETPGEWSHRGGIIDIFPYERTNPVRIELVGDRICSIREFNPEEQISLNKLEQVQFYLINPRSRFKDSYTLLEYLPEDTLVVLREDFPSDREILRKKLAKYSLISFHTLPVSQSDEETINYEITSVQRFNAGLSNIIKELQTLRERQYQVSIFCQNQGEIVRLKEILAGTDLENDNGLALKIGSVSQGFVFPEISRIFISHSELFNRYRQPRRFRPIPETGPAEGFGMLTPESTEGPSEARPIETFLELEKGDLVVHDLHGIGRYLGIENIQRDGFTQECLVIEYQDRSKLYVPVYQISEVQKYLGGRSDLPALDRLGSGFWELRKERVSKAVNRLALELLEIQAIREKDDGIIFPEDTEWQTEFEASFPYEDTADQIKITEVIKRDMTSSRPMDRLICGDVGYGKTELSMRAAFKTATAGYQVAVLVPTTVLAQQHYQNFTERMADYPVNIEMLSRFRTRPVQSEITRKVKKGQVDIIIGTHRLLSADIQFKNLGLIIIDEEQRFGVEHKERLKKLRAIVDILTLTATPIPRTLHMSLLGIRDISTLATPPQDRRAIQTRVSRFDPELIREAVLREINRAGQVYFVHNRIYDIQSIASELQQIVPEASFAIAHGQMPADELEEKMNRFVQGKIDVLVSTNIIESGLDIPRVNTIFVNNAHQFGLSDLHQLRGRVGRYKHQAFAYFLIPPDKPILPDAVKRLKAIQEFNELGAGFKIAMRDMEIRGVGNILGPQQSGHIATVGYELYCRLLENAIRRIKNQPVKPTREVEVKLNINASLPAGYIPSEKQRLEIYRKIGRVTDRAGSEAVKSELEDRFGKPVPDEVVNLLELAQVKSLAQKYSITGLIQSDKDGVIIANYLNQTGAEKLKKRSPKSIRIIDERTLHIILPRMLPRGVAAKTLGFLKALFAGQPR